MKITNNQTTRAFRAHVARELEAKETLSQREYENRERAARILRAENARRVAVARGIAA